MPINIWAIKPPSRLHAAPLYIQLAEAFVAHIREFSIPANTPMPSEAELMVRYNLSRITVRQAITRLCAEGWATKIQGKGTFTASPAARAVAPAWCLPDGNLWQEPTGIEEKFLDAVEYPPCLKYSHIFNLGATEGTYRVRVGKILNGHLVGIETRHFPCWVADLHKEALHQGHFETLLRQHPDTTPARVHYELRTAAASDYEAALLDIHPEAFVFTFGCIHYNKRQTPVMSGRVVYKTTLFPLEYDIVYTR